MSFSIRPANRDDATNLAALSIQVWLNTYATGGIRRSFSEHVFSEYRPERFEAILDDPRQALLLAEADQHLLGYARLNTCSPAPGAEAMTSELCTLYVQAPFHGQGIGGALLAACRDFLKTEIGDVGLWLSVYHQNHRALAFYAKHGFTRGASFNFEFGGEAHLNYVLFE